MAQYRVILIFCSTDVRRCVQIQGLRPSKDLGYVTLPNYLGQILHQVDWK